MNVYIFIVVTFSMSLKGATHDAGDGMMRDSVYDCRFWREPKQEIAKMIMNNKKDKQESVFYFWNTSAVSCQPCTVCMENTLSSCTTLRDTVCITHLELMKMGIKGNSVLEDQEDYEGSDDEVLLFTKHSPQQLSNQWCTASLSTLKNQPWKIIHPQELFIMNTKIKYLVKRLM
jgi:hypothetical protein